MRKAEQKKAEAFENWCWRRVLHVRWTERRSNASVRHQVQLKLPLLSIIYRQQWSFLGHIVRAGRIEATIALGKMIGSGERGDSV